jgi:hypothetical protein
LISWSEQILKLLDITLLIQETHKILDTASESICNDVINYSGAGAEDLKAQKQASMTINELRVSYSKFK